jgi:hypothetical protein
MTVTTAKQPPRWGPPRVEKALGALPVIAQFCRQLDLAGIADRVCPVRDVAHLTHGQVVEALVANRLTSPSPLVHIPQWARGWAVEEIFGIAPDLLGDDRLGRTRDAIAPKLDPIIGSVGTAAISTFGVDVARLHPDMTSISRCGAFDHPDQDLPAPQTGRATNGTLGVQVQAGLAVAADGGIPIFHHAYDGQVTQAMTAWKTLAEARSFLLVGDLQTGQLPHPGRAAGRQGVLHRPGEQDSGARRGPVRPGGDPGCRAGLPRRTRP